MSAPTEEGPRAGRGTAVLEPPRSDPGTRGTGSRGGRQATIPAPRTTGEPATGLPGTGLPGTGWPGTSARRPRHPGSDGPQSLLDRPGRLDTPGRPAGGRIGKAYARRDGRLQRLTGARGRSTQAAQAALAVGRTPFLLLVMVLLAVGLVATLWLSTAAAADSYRLTDARAAAQALSERSEQLHRQVAAMEAAPALAQRAGQLGMVPVTDAARLVVAPDGSVTVVGTPTAALAPVVPVAPAAAPAIATTADGQVAAADQPAATVPPAAGTPPGAATPSGVTAPARAPAAPAHAPTVAAHASAALPVLASAAHLSAAHLSAPHPSAAHPSAAHVSTTHAPAVARQASGPTPTVG